MPSSRLIVSIPKASADGKFYGRWPNGDAPVTFDYYISPTGSDSNPGTLDEPWAITTLVQTGSSFSSNWSKINGTGVSIGVIGDQGTYSVASLMANDASHGALVIPGGASPEAMNYVASCNSAGVYERGLATFDAFLEQMTDTAATVTNASGPTATLNLSASAVGAASINSMVEMAGLPPGCCIVSGSGSTWSILNCYGTAISNLSSASARSGLYGGFHSTGSGVYNGPIIGHTGQVYFNGAWQPYAYGNLVIDGLIFTGFSYKGVRIGGGSSGDGPIITSPVSVQNCTFTGAGFNLANAQFTASISGTTLTVSEVSSGTLYKFMPINFPGVPNGVLITSLGTGTGGTGTYGLNTDFTTPVASQSMTAGDPIDNCASLWVDPFQPTGSQGISIYNNFFKDNIGWAGPTNTDHLNGIICWGFSTQSYGIEISYNTLDNAGNIYGKEGGVNGAYIHHNYTPGINDFMSGGGTIDGLTRPTDISYNVVVVSDGEGCAIGFPTEGRSQYGSTYGWQTPVSVYNNTIVSNATVQQPMAICADAAQDQSGIGKVKVYNNIYANPAGTTGTWDGYGNFLTTPKSPSLWDYNLVPSGTTSWSITPDANNFSLCASSTVYSSPASFGAAIAAGGGISGVDAHSVTGVPTFTGEGSYAAAYQLATASVGKNAGSDGNDMGACGGATLPGCSFAA